MIPHNTRSGYHGLQTSFHQANEPTLAGVGHLHAVMVQGCVEPAVQRPRNRAVRGGTGSRKRVHAGRHRSAAPRRVQRHLGSRQGLPGERTSLLRRRHPKRDELRRRRAQSSAPAAARGCDPTARSSRATTTSSRRRTRRTCACSSGFRWAVASASISSARRSTCSTGRTGASALRRAARTTSRDLGAVPRGAARVPIEVLDHGGSSPRSRVQRGRVGDDPSRPLLVIHVLFFLSGLSALIYQVAWVRLFGRVFGNTTYSASLVVAVFMLGLGVGSLVTGSVGRSTLRGGARIAAARVRMVRDRDCRDGAHHRRAVAAPR